ncbi:membrane-bound lytic murein transglycosylase A [Alphaproteobacteria bacterium]
MPSSASVFCMWRCVTLSFRFALLSVLFIVLTSCSAHRRVGVFSTVGVYFQKVGFNSLDGWVDDDHYLAVKTFLRSCNSIFANQLEDSAVSRYTSIGGKVRSWKRVCQEAKKVTDRASGRKFLETWFVPYQITDISKNAKGRFTGYYEIELNGSRNRTTRFKYPVYATPKNISALKGSERLTHAAINRGSLAKQNLELAWVDNSARLFFMQIQGSGVIKLQDNEELKLGYAEQNGFPYKSVVQDIRSYSRTKIESATDMMDWLHGNGEIGQSIMEQNPSYVFFRPIHGKSPIGAQGVPLESERSLAIDARIFPYSTPFWVETELPRTPNFPRSGYRRLFIAQDKGGAIKGAVRADIFFGRGRRAEELAGYMNVMGQYYALFPKTVDVPNFYMVR